MEEVLKELENLTEEIKAKTEKIDEIEKQLGSVTEEITKIKTLAITTPEATREKAKKEFGNYIKKAVTTGSTGAEYTLPIEIYTEVQDMINNYGVVGKLSKNIPMSSKTMKVPVAGSVNVYYPDEGIEIPESNNIFANGLTLTAKKQAALVNISREMLQWSEIQLANYVSELIARDMAKEEDRQALLGTGPFNGIGYNSSVPALIGAAGQTGYGWIDSEQIIKAIGLVNSDYQTSDVVLIMNSVVFFNLLQKQKKITSTTNGYVIDATVGLNPPTVLGYRVFFSEVMPNYTNGASLPYVIVGNFKGHLRGVGQEITVEISKDFNFAKDLITIKATRLHSVGNIITKAFARIVSAAAAV